jgi:hypothetical protein
MSGKARATSVAQRLGALAAIAASAAARAVLVAALLTACAAPTPSRPPTEPPSATPSPRAEALATFRAQASSALASAGPLVQALGTASAGTNEDVAAVAVQLRTWVAMQQAWLEEHPADACYEAAQASVQRGVAAIAKSADAFAALAAASDPIDPAAGATAADDLAAGVAELTAAIPQADGARSACT